MQYWDDGLVSVSKKNDELYHFGIKGMKWGERRYQNLDGTLTPEGKIRYSKMYEKYDKAGAAELAKRETDFRTRANIEQVLATQNSKFNQQVANRILKENAEHDNDKANSIYNDELLKVYNRSIAKQVADFHMTNKNFQKARELSEKYGMVEWNELARINDTGLKDLTNILNSTPDYSSVEDYSKKKVTKTHDPSDDWTEYEGDDDPELRELWLMEQEEKKRGKDS